MILGFAEDFSTTTDLDSDLLVSDSGLFFNRGVHQSITVDNLLHFLPNTTFTFTAYAAGNTYTKFETSRKKTDIVLDGGIIYQSIADANTGNTPASSPTFWLVTNIESLRLKSFIFSVFDKVKAELNIVRRLIDSQDLYIVNKDAVEQALPNDFAGWVFEPKGSDYVKIRINSGSLQKSGTTPVNLYVVNQGTLITTLTLTPTNGTVTFEDLNYSFIGKGKFLFVIDSTDTFVGGDFVDPLKYDGFVAYTTVGIGTTAATATYSDTLSSNGLNFNITAHLEATTYIDDNFVEYAQFIQAAFELEVLNMYLSNSGNRSNFVERIQMSKDIIIAEAKELNHHTVAFKYERERAKAEKLLKKTFDKHLSSDNDDIVIKYTSI